MNSRRLNIGLAPIAQVPPITLPQPITGGRFAPITIAHQGWQETAALRDFGSAHMTANWVKLGHSALSARCPVCPKADTAGRFIITRPSRFREFNRDTTFKASAQIAAIPPWPFSARPGDGSVAPRVVFPPLNQNGNPPPVASVAPSAPMPPAAANGTIPNNEPRSIKTLAVKSDVAENGGIPAAPQSRFKISDRVGQPSSSDQVAPVAQRVVLYDEDPSDLLRFFRLA